MISKNCFRISRDVIDSVSIAYNPLVSTVALWNKFQIFVYNDFMFEQPSTIWTLVDFVVSNLILYDNYILCLDCDGNFHIATLKCKTDLNKRFKPAFQLREKGIKIVEKYHDDYALSIKFAGATHSLCVHRINSNLHLVKSMTIQFKDAPPDEGKNGKYLLFTATLTKEDCDCDLFSVMAESHKKEYCEKGCDLVLISFDNYTVYACVLSIENSKNVIQVFQVYSCPAEICDIQIVRDKGVYFQFSLKLGTVIRLPMNDMTKSPLIVHLNTALYKMIAVNNYLIYTDGVTLYKSEQILDTIKFTELFFKDIKDIKKCGERIICTTFTKLIYIFHLDDDNIIVPKVENDYYPAEKLFETSMDTILALFATIDEYNILKKKLNEEQNFISAAFLTDRQDLMHRAISTQVVIYDKYSEMNQDIILTEPMFHYFEPKVWMFLIQLSTSYTNLNNILPNLLTNYQVHITFSFNGKSLKTTSLTLEEQLHKLNILIPLNIQNLFWDIEMNIKIIVNTPKALERNLNSSVILYKKCFKFDAKYFVKSNKDLKYCKGKMSLASKLHETNLTHYGNLFSINITKELRLKYKFYVKLPENYKEVCSNIEYDAYMCAKRVDSMALTSIFRDLFKSNTDIGLTIGDVSIVISTPSDGILAPVVEVSGESLEALLSIRNHLAVLIYNNFENFSHGQKFVNHHLYTVVENLNKEVKEFTSKDGNIDAFLQLRDHFERNVIGALPM